MVARLGRQLAPGEARDGPPSILDSHEGERTCCLDAQTFGAVPLLREWVRAGGRGH